MAPAGEGARQGREWERARREGPRRGRGPRAAAPAAAPLAASFRWRKTLRLGVWQIVFRTPHHHHHHRRLPRPVKEAKADFDCSAVAGPTPGLGAPGSRGTEAPRALQSCFAKCVSEGHPEGVKGCLFVLFFCLPPAGPIWEQRWKGSGSGLWRALRAARDFGTNQDPLN